MEAAKAGLQQLILERDFYRKELFIANQVIGESNFQILEFNRLDRLLTDAHRQLYIRSPEGHSKPPLPKNWIGTWQSSPHEFPALVCAEDAWRQGNLQAALSHMPGMLNRDDFDLQHRVNVRILYAAMVLSSGVNYPIALRYAEEALQLAFEHRLYNLAR